METVLVTGSAGFIGFHAAQRWLREGWRVVGLDAFTDYYDPALKEARAALLRANPGYVEVRDRIERAGVLDDLMREHRPTQVLHMAAQAGVRYSIEAPRSYVDANLLGTFELLEAARAHPPKRLLLASTSSVYGANTSMPFSEADPTGHQVSFYAATKRANEAMAHSYSHLFGLPTVMFRFFTVYGPWGRPDMALFKFVSAMLQDRPIDIYNHGLMRRDFTYIDDLVEAVWRLSEAPIGPAGDAVPEPGQSPVAPFRIVNIGKSQPDTLIDFVTAIEKALGVEARKNYLDMQPGDVPDTHSSTDVLRSLTGYVPETPIEKGIPAFVSWYRHYFGV